MPPRGRIGGEGATRQGGDCRDEVRRTLRHALRPSPAPRSSRSPPSYDLAALGYTNDEFFLEGTARSYAGPAQEAPFRTRAVVRRPVDAARWNGSVVVEWFNVSGGLDAAPDWSFLHRHILRAGFAYVGVSVQTRRRRGRRLRGDPDPAEEGERRALRLALAPGRRLRVRPLLAGGPRDPRGAPARRAHAARVLAVGESQSAMFLVTYVNAVDPDARAFDGFLIHGRGGMGAPLDGSSIIREPLSRSARRR